MNRHMDMPLIPHTDYYKYDIVMQSGVLPDQDPVLVDAIRRLIIFSYVSDMDGLSNLDLVYGNHPLSEQSLVTTITKGSWNSLFRLKNGYPIDFRGWLGECLAFWAAKKFKGYPYVSGAKPSSTDPAYDLIAFEWDGAQFLVRWVQAKSTESNVQQNTALAVKKFGKIEKGEYGAEVSYALRSAYREAKAENVNISVNDTRLLQLDRSRWRYTVFVIYNEGPGGEMMTEYKTHIPGPKERREAVLMKFADVTAFLTQLEAQIRANLP